jgi:hypothetical protein
MLGQRQQHQIEQTSDSPTSRYCIGCRRYRLSFRKQKGHKRQRYQQNGIFCRPIGQLVLIGRRGDIHAESGQLTPLNLPTLNKNFAILLANQLLCQWAL